jgi:hypothetical protein
MKVQRLPPRRPGWKRSVRRRFAITVLLLGAASRARAVTLSGVVITNEVGGPPVANAQITAVGANPATSGTDGMFPLRFPGRQPGEMVQVVVSKQGYVVVNASQLRLALPKDAHAELLTLLLCKERDREEMARRFYHLKTLEAIEQRYRGLLQSLVPR